MKNIRFFLMGITFLFLIFGASGTGFSQDCADLYYVVHVEGTIQNRATGKLLKLKDEIRNESEIVFVTPDAFAVVLSPQKGKFTLILEKKPEEVKGENKAVRFIKGWLLSCRKSISAPREAFINDEQMKTMEAEVNLLISILKYHKKEDKIKEYALDFLKNVYYSENDKDKAENALKKIRAK